MIKMVRKVSYELIPFVLLFLFAMTMFGFVFGCLDLPFGDDYSCIGLNGDNYKFFVKPYQKWYGKTTCNDIIDSLISDLPSNDA